jgi:TonB family protein
VGNINILEDEAKANSVDFTRLPTDDNRFRSVEVDPAVMQTLTADQTPIAWPAVRSGVVKGKLAVYISVDNTGLVREAWPLNSDNAGLEDPAREQVRKWKLKPAVDGDGTRVQVEGGIGFSFETKIDNPLPLLSNADIRQLATKVAEPVWPANGLQRGQIVTVEISVNEQGKLTGTSYKGTTSAAAVGALMDAIKKWEFRPLIRDGKPQYFHGTLEFVVP